MKVKEEKAKRRTVLSFPKKEQDTDRGKTRLGYRV